MSDQPTSSGDNPSDPFHKIVTIITSHHNYLSEIVKATCRDRTAYRFESPATHRQTYVLIEEEDAEKAAASHFHYGVKNPAPSTSIEFAEAIRQGRELAAKAGIPFAEIDPVFRGCAAHHDRVDAMAIFPPSAKDRLIESTGGKLTGPYRLNDVWLNECFIWQPLRERLWAFSIHVRGAGLSPESKTNATEGTKRRYQDRDDEVIRLKKEKPSRNAGQIAQLIRENSAWAKLESGRDFDARAVRSILTRARKSGRL